jgi:hypothetical protein
MTQWHMKRTPKDPPPSNKQSKSLLYAYPQLTQIKIVSIFALVQVGARVWNMEML